eukprot:15342941-Ditylum_brightwellii.AAC.1
MMMELYANMASIPTTLGGGAHGHIELVMEATLYSTLLTTAYTSPPQPTRGTLLARPTLIYRKLVEIF